MTEFYEKILRDRLWLLVPVRFGLVANVWSRHLVECVEPEAVGLGCPDFADVLIGCEPPKGPERTGEVVGGQEVAEVALELIVSVVVVPDRRVLEFIGLIRSSSRSRTMGSVPSIRSCRSRTGRTTHDIQGRRASIMAQTTCWTRAPLCRLPQRGTNSALHRRQIRSDPNAWYFGSMSSRGIDARQKYSGPE
jgi:hypothetical protein